MSTFVGSPVCVNRLHYNIRAVLERDHLDCNQKCLTKYLHKNKYVYKDTLPSLVKPCCRMKASGLTNENNDGIFNTVDICNVCKPIGVVENSSLNSKKANIKTSKDLPFLSATKNRRSHTNVVGSSLPVTQGKHFIDLRLPGVNVMENREAEKNVDLQDSKKTFTDEDTQLRSTAKWSSFNHDMDNSSFSNLPQSQMENKELINIPNECTNVSTRKTPPCLLPKEKQIVKEYTSIFKNVTNTTHRVTPLDILNYSKTNFSRTLDTAGNSILYPEEPSISHQIPEILSKAHQKLEPMKTLFAENNKHRDSYI